MCEGKSMNPKKPKHLKSIPAGISLEPALTKKAKAVAKAEGYGSLSAYVRFVLTRALNDAADAAEIKGKKHQAAAKSKLPPRKKNQ
jgi:hypothetical protein